MIRFLVASLLLTACGSGHRCTDRANASGAGSDLGLGQCWDGVDRQVTCDPVPTGGLDCRCLAGGTVQRTVHRAEPILGTDAQALMTVNEVCGWDLVE